MITVKVLVALRPNHLKSGLHLRLYILTYLDHIPSRKYSDGNRITILCGDHTPSCGEHGDGALRSVRASRTWLSCLSRSRGLIDAVVVPLGRPFLDTVYLTTHLSGPAWLCASSTAEHSRSPFERVSSRLCLRWWRRKLYDLLSVQLTSQQAAKSYIYLDRKCIDVVSLAFRIT